MESISGGKSTVTANEDLLPPVPTTSTPRQSNSHEQNIKRRVCMFKNRILRSLMLFMPSNAAVSAKKYWLSLLALTATMLLVLAYQLHIQSNLPSTDFTLYYTLLKQVSQTEDCAIPEMDPWDASIQKYLSQADLLVCKQLQHELTYLQEGRIVFNTSELAAAGYADWTHISCQFRCFDRKEGDDVTLEYGKWMKLENATQPNCEFIEVKCYKSFPPIAIYTNLHSQIVPLQTSSANTHKAPSVLLFVVDSVSQSNWRRNLPKTLKVLEKDYHSHVFKGFTKVGDNSFPNAVAFLTGRRVVAPGYQSELPDDMSDQFFDDWPILWRDFKEQGYVTYYAEDYPQFNLFKYLANGFEHKPTDHYFRPYWLQLYGSFLHRRSTHLCYGNQPCHTIQLNYLRDFIEKYRRDGPRARPTFALNWLTELGHDWLNQVRLGDQDLADFFRTQKHNLKDSFVFVFSDHGHRFDPIRQSLIGRIEERMPFFSLHVPEWLAKQCSCLENTLKGNSHKLTSFWDLYVTLRDVLHIQANNSWTELCGNPSDNDRAEERFRKYSRRGLSLLRPLPPVRNCGSAGIPEDFCICQRETIVNVSNPKVRSAASALIGHLNAMLADYSKQCAQLQLKGIHNAQTFLPNLKMAMDPHSKRDLILGGLRSLTSSNPTNESIQIVPTSGFYANYRVTVEVLPSGGIFEGTIQNHVLHNTYNVIGDVSRINKYGNQSSCVNSAHLRKYCYCI